MANHSDHGIRKSNRIVHNSRHRTAVNTEELFNEKATGQYWNSRKGMIYDSIGDDIDRYYCSKTKQCSI